MAKDPAFLFYPSDFLTGTMFMNHEQIGIYVRLLCSQHQHGGLIDKVSFNTLVGDNSMLRAKFIETETGFYNERLAKEMDKRNKKSNNLSKTAKEVWAKRKAEKDTIVIQSYNETNTNVTKNDTIVIRTVNENINVNKDNNTIPEFSEFLEYAKIQKPNVCETALKLKYDSWVVNGWKNGNDKKIKNWKNTLNNTLPYIKESDVKPVYTGKSVADQIEEMRKYGNRI